MKILHENIQKNGTCSVALGMQADDRQRLLLVIDHLLSEAHAAVTEHHRLETLYDAQSDKHP